MSGKRNLRPCRFNGKNYLFLCWGHEAHVIEPSPMRGGHPGGQVSYTYAILEDELGKIHRVDPNGIQFLDNLYNEYKEKGTFE